MKKEPKDGWQPFGPAGVKETGTLEWGSEGSLLTRPHNQRFKGVKKKGRGSPYTNKRQRGKSYALLCIQEKSLAANETRETPI